MSDSGAAAVRTCKLCGGTGPFTKEHVVPQWTATSLPGSGGRFTLERGTEAGPLHRRESAKTPVIVRICDACHRVLSLLENWASGRLGPLVASPAAPETFDSRDQIMMAAWTFKTVMLLDLADPPPRLSFNERRALMEGRRPPVSCCAWVGIYDGAAPGVRYWRKGLMLMGPNVATGTAPATMVTMRIGHFVAQVLAIAAGTVTLSRMSDSMVQVWPSQHESIDWPGSLVPLDYLEFERLSQPFQSVDDVSPRQPKCRADCRAGPPAPAESRFTKAIKPRRRARLKHR